MNPKQYIARCLCSELIWTSVFQSYCVTYDEEQATGTFQYAICPTTKFTENYKFRSLLMPINLGQNCLEGKIPSKAILRLPKQ